jgi:uncharacterized membrane protein YdfJ with MMPL/SSD domain
VALVVRDGARRAEGMEDAMERFRAALAAQRERAVQTGAPAPAVEQVAARARANVADLDALERRLLDLRAQLPHDR